MKLKAGLSKGLDTEEEEEMEFTIYFIGFTVTVEENKIR